MQHIYLIVSRMYSDLIRLRTPSIMSSEKFRPFYKEIMNAQHFSFYIILSNYVWSILFYQDKDYNVRQIRFHVCIKMCRYIIKNVSVKERYFPDNLIPVLRSKGKLNIFSIARWWDRRLKKFTYF